MANLEEYRLCGPRGKIKAFAQVLPYAVTTLSSLTGRDRPVAGCGLQAVVCCGIRCSSKDSLCVRNDLLVKEEAFHPSSLACTYISAVSAPLLLSVLAEKGPGWNNENP